MKKSIALFLFVSSTFLISSCQKDDDSLTNQVEETPPIVPVTNSYANVPPQLWDYFQRFESTAAARGFAVDLESANISAEISEITDAGVAGSCTYGSSHPGHIVIDLGFWNQASDLLKEMVIFHELGHCFLHRGHREDMYTNGACVSIMRSGLGTCLDNYRTETRPVYLDELFGGN